MTHPHHRSSPTPLTIAEADVPALTRGMRRVWARVRLSETPVAAPRDEWELRGRKLLRSLGLFGKTGLTLKGMVASECSVVPTLASSMGSTPEADGYWLDVVTLPRLVAPCTAVSRPWFQVGLANALLASAGVSRPSSIRRSWLEAARLWLAEGGVVDGWRAQAVNSLWPCSPVRLIRGVYVVRSVAERMAA